MTEINGSIATAFRAQSDLQEVIYGDTWRRLVDEGPDGVPGLRDVMLTGYLTSLIVEAAEALQSMRFRPEWDTDETNMKDLKEELVDVFSFLMNAGIVSFGTPEKFWEAYIAKWGRNYNRAKVQRESSLSGRPQEQSAETPSVDEQLQARNIRPVPAGG